MRSSRCSRSPCKRDEPLLRDGGRWGNFRSDGFRRALAFYLEMFQRGWAPVGGECGDLERVERVRPRPVRVLRVGAVEHRRAAAAAAGRASSRAGRRRRCPGLTARALRSRAARAWWCFGLHAHQAAAWQLIEFLSQPTVQRRFHALTGDLPPRRSFVARSAAGGDVTRAPFASSSSASSRRPRCPSGSASPPRCGSWPSARCAWGCRRTRPLRELDARTDRILEKRRWILARRSGG